MGKMDFHDLAITELLRALQIPKEAYEFTLRWKVTRGLTLEVRSYPDLSTIYGASDVITKRYRLLQVMDE